MPARERRVNKVRQKAGTSGRETATYLRAPLGHRAHAPAPGIEKIKDRGERKDTPPSELPTSAKSRQDKRALPVYSAA